MDVTLGCLLLRELGARSPTRELSVPHLVFLSIVLLGSMQTEKKGTENTRAELSVSVRRERISLSLPLNHHAPWMSCNRENRAAAATR